MRLGSQKIAVDGGRTGGPGAAFLDPAAVARVGGSNMARTVGSSGARTMAAIRKAGLRLIYTYGYEAMSLRQLAAEVGIQQGSLYNHIRNKQDLLFELIAGHMHQLLGALEKALEGITDPVRRLEAFTTFHVGYHVARKQEVFISYSELRSLAPPNYDAIVRMRGAYERRLIDILEEGMAAGRFVAVDAKVAAYGILAMLSGIPTWFKPRGRLTKDDVSAIYRRMVVNAVSAGGRHRRALRAA
jgi:AcrR family transcriptional regulator